MERLYFRPLVMEDKDQLLAIYSDKDAMQYRASKPLETLADAEEFIKQAQQETESKIKVRVAVVQKNTEVIIGTAMYCFESPTAVEIGFSIGREFWKFGYGKEGTLGLINYVKMHENAITTIIGITHSQNEKSLKMVDSLGFKEVLDYKVENKRRFELKIR